MSNEIAFSEIVDIPPSEAETVADSISPSAEIAVDISASGIDDIPFYENKPKTRFGEIQAIGIDDIPFYDKPKTRFGEIQAIGIDDIPFYDKPKSRFGEIEANGLDDIPFSGSDSPRISVSYNLLNAVLDGDWDEIIELVTHDPSCLHNGITEKGDSILHMAVVDSKVEVVKALIEIDPTSLRYTNNVGNTAFFHAASFGLLEIAEMMVQQDKELPHIRGISRMTPLHRAVMQDRRHMVNYLLNVTDDDRLFDPDRIEILIWSITHDLFDVALHILKNHLELALMRDSSGLSALHALARRPLKMADGHQPSIRKILSGRFTTQSDEPKRVLELAKMLWCKMVLQSKEEVAASIKEPWPLLSCAVGLGKVEFVTVPILSTIRDENGYNIIHHAVIHRQPEIFKLLYMDEFIRMTAVVSKDKKQNNMLHLAGKLASRHSLNNVSGAALQMQRELQWFQAVKQCVRYDYVEAENADKETPQDLFSKEHEELRKQGEEWMKKTAESCALVAALITTMVFSAAFQLPGGLIDTGSPVLLKNTSFVIFAMLNAVSLFTSTSSILVFLSILTSRYAQRDFLRSLPEKLIIGLVLLLISIATMVGGFTVTFFIIFQEGLRWPPIVIGILASVPVILFAFQQFPLLAEMYYSTYKFTNALLPGQQTVFKGTSIKLLAFYGRSLAELNAQRGHFRDSNKDDFVPF